MYIIVPVKNDGIIYLCIFYIIILVFFFSYKKKN